MQAPVESTPLHQARRRPDLLDADSPSGLDVLQLTSDPDQPATHIYMESPVFTPDARRFVYQTIEPPVERFLRVVPNKRYWLCDLADDFALRPLTDEPYATAPMVSPDGAWMYYFVFQPRVGEAGTLLKRVSLESFERETLMRFDAPLPLPEPFEGLARFPTKLYMLGTISADGRRVATGACFGDGVEAPPIMGVLVCDLAAQEAWVPFAARDLVNPHPQYCRAIDPATGEASRDLMIQHNNGGGTCDADGVVTSLGRGGAELLVVQDDGSERRDIPCGLGERELCHGHECWRGHTRRILAGASWPQHEPPTRPIIETEPVPHQPQREHRGCRHPHAEAVNIDLTRAQNAPAYVHFATDPTGQYFVGDNPPIGEGPEKTQLCIGTLRGDSNPQLDVTHLLRPRSGTHDTVYRPTQASHVHPFLSPDARRAFFNSDCDGIPQIWMVQGYRFP